MDVIRDSIEEQAEAALNAQRELPLYRHDAAYAREQGDLDLYRASRRANIACKEAIENATPCSRKTGTGGSAQPTRRGPRPWTSRPTRTDLAATATWTLWWIATPVWSICF